MLIDIHTHAYRIKPPLYGFCNLAELLKANERLGIDMAVVQPIVSPEIYIAQPSEDILEMAKQYPDKIIPFCNVDPRSYTNSPFSPLEEFLEAYKEMGAKGVGEVMPNMRMDDPMVQNLFRACEKVGLSVTTDGTGMPDHNFGLYDDPGLPMTEMTLRRFPNLIYFGHGPAFWAEIAKLETPGERCVPYKFATGQVSPACVNRGPIREEGVIAKLCRRYPNLHLDLSDGTAYNALTRDEDYIAEFIREFSDRMYFGTDLCSPDQRVPLIGKLKEWLDRGVITKTAYNQITHENAMRHLKL